MSPTFAIVSIEMSSKIDRKLKKLRKKLKKYKEKNVALEQKNVDLSQALSQWKCCAKQIAGQRDQNSILIQNLQIGMSDLQRANAYLRQDNDLIRHKMAWKEGSKVD